MNIDIRPVLYRLLLIENKRPANRRPIIFPEATIKPEISRECDKEFINPNEFITDTYVSKPTKLGTGCKIDQFVKE